MAKPLLISLSLCFLLLFHGSLARQRQDLCRLHRLRALEPDQRIPCEAGMIETWNPDHEQFRCAGVAVVKHTIRPSGLLLPFYTTAPQLVFIAKGRGKIGIIQPAECPETLHGNKNLDQQQKQQVTSYRRGDIIALPGGVPHWHYNNGNEEIVAISVIGTADNIVNQLDNNPRNFYLAGNPVNEFANQYERLFEHGQQQYFLRTPGQQGSCNNVFCGMGVNLTSEVFNIDPELASKLIAEDDERGHIVRVNGKFDIVTPMSNSQGENEQYPIGGDESFCTLKMKANIADPSSTDVYYPGVGSVSTVNSHNLPMLELLQLSASRVVLHKDTMVLPIWNTNADSIIYVEKGDGRVQIVDHEGRSVFDGKVTEGQVLTVPRSYVASSRAQSDILEYVVFKTNGNAITYSLAGRTSVFRALPVDVITKAFQISEKDARTLKFNRVEYLLIKKND